MTSPNKDEYMNVHGQQLEATQTFNKKWVDNQILAYPYNRIPNSKNEWTIEGCNNIDESQNDYAEWGKESQGKKKAYTVYFHLHKILQNEK